MLQDAQFRGPTLANGRVLSPFNILEIWSKIATLKSKPGLAAPVKVFGGSLFGGTMATVMKSALCLSRPEFKERRGALRIKIKQRLPGKLTTSDGVALERCLLLNVSDAGLGVVTSERVMLNSYVNLDLDDRRIQLRVVWRSFDEQHHRYRYGLRLVSTDISLIDCFEAHLVREQILSPT